MLVTLATVDKISTGIDRLWYWSLPLMLAGGVAAGADARALGGPGHARRVGHIPVAVEIDFRDRVEVHGLDAERIDARHARRDMRGAGER